MWNFACRICGTSRGTPWLRHGLWELCPGTKVLVWVCLPSLLALTRGGLVGLNQDYKAKHLGNIISTVLTGRCTPKKWSGPSLFAGNSNLRLAFHHLPQAAGSCLPPTSLLSPAWRRPRWPLLPKVWACETLFYATSPFSQCLGSAMGSVGGLCSLHWHCSQDSRRWDWVPRSPRSSPQHQGLHWACWQEVEAREEQLPWRTEAQRGQEDPAEERHGVSWK